MVNGRRGDRGILVNKPAAILFGGPRDGWSYFIKDLEQLIRIERDFKGREFCYVPSGVMVPHPRTFHEVQSERWDYVEELDPFLPAPPEPPTPTEMVLSAIALCGRHGGQLIQIVNNLPPELLEMGDDKHGVPYVLDRHKVAVNIAPIVWTLEQRGQIESNPADPWHERRYRRVINAQEPAS